MKVVSVNVGLPRTITWKGRTLQTGIFKAPISGRVQVRTLNLDGDRQADLSVHGGPDKAIYLYPSEHNGYWQGEFPEMELPWGMFGENFTTEGVLEETVNIGDRWRIGSALVMVTQPRVPCYKLAAKFGRQDIVKRFLASGRSGFYLRVMQEGKMGVGDPIELMNQDRHGVTVTDVIKLYRDGADDLGLYRRAVQVEALSEGWRAHFQQQIDQLQR
jgi:MOSC domain-containing protein YiiM